MGVPMQKYQGFGGFLEEQNTDEVRMSFAEIEGVIGAKLPPSAHKHRPWWSNNASNSAMTKVWLDAGFRTEQVDMAGKKLVFKRVRASVLRRETSPEHQNREVSEFSRGFVPAEKKPRRHPAFGALKGTFTIEPGYDLTQPAMPEWADLIDEKYGPEIHK
jgi:hypothetical protein